MSYRPYNTLKSTGVALGGYTNSSGVDIDKATPVRQDASGDIDFINVSIESDIKRFLGLTNATILNGASGEVAITGKIENVTTSFDFGDSLYISKSGTLVNVEPDIGVNGFVSGDFVYYIGVIAKNEDNPTLKDIVLAPDLRGQL